MGIEKNRKNFKSKSTYLIHFINYTIWLAGGLWFLLWGLSASEKELLEMFSDQELTGSSSQRGAQVIEAFLVSKWGKPGLLSIPILVVLGILYYFYKDIFEYIRFLRKDKLYRKGLVDNLYDDYQSRTIVQRVKGLFGKGKNGKRKSVYLSKKEMENRLKNDEFYKKMHK